MRILRKLMLLAMLAIAAGAMTASSALAQNAEPLLHNQTPRLIVQQELHAATDINCPLVTPSPAPNPAPLATAGGCRVHVNGPGIVFTEHTVAGVEEIIATCNVEVEMRVDVAGEGYWTHQELTPAPVGTCNYKACGQVTPPASEGRAWSFFMQETEPAPRERITVLFCIEPVGSSTPEHCEFTLPFTQLTTHRYRFTAVNAAAHGTLLPRCELDGQFDTEAATGNNGELQARQNIEIRHT